MAKLKKITGFIFLSLFYFITGIALLVTMVQSNSVIPHVGLLGVLSLMASYGLNKMKRWAIFLILLTSLSGITFGCVTIYITCNLINLGWVEIISLFAMTLYVTLLAISIFYLMLKKDKFG